MPYKLDDFFRDFPDDEAVLRHIWRQRYAPDGEHADCPKCNQRRVFKRYQTKQSRQSWTCTGCGHHLHPTSGTVLENSGSSLRDWYFVVYLVATGRTLTCTSVQRELGVNYKTAHRMVRFVQSIAEVA